MYYFLKNLRCDVCGGLFPIWDDKKDILPTLYCIPCLIRRLIRKLKNDN